MDMVLVVSLTARTGDVEGVEGVVGVVGVVTLVASDMAETEDTVSETEQVLEVSSSPVFFPRDLLCDVFTKVENWKLFIFHELIKDNMLSATDKLIASTLPVPSSSLSRPRWRHA